MGLVGLDLSIIISTILYYWVYVVFLPEGIARCPLAVNPLPLFPYLKCDTNAITHFNVSWVPLIRRRLGELLYIVLKTVHPPVNPMPIHVGDQLICDWFMLDVIRAEDKAWLLLHLVQDPSKLLLNLCRLIKLFFGLNHVPCCCLAIDEKAEIEICCCCLLGAFCSPFFWNSWYRIL